MKRHAPSRFCPVPQPLSFRSHLKTSFLGSFLSLPWLELSDMGTDRMSGAFLSKRVFVCEGGAIAVLV